jgi:hypothetical protein
MVRPGGLPPRQREPLVRRVAMPTLILVTTGVLVGLIVLFMRGTKPRYLPLEDRKVPASKTATLDGWHDGLPSKPARSDPPPKPAPLVDEEARRDVRLLRQLM